MNGEWIGWLIGWMNDKSNGSGPGGCLASPPPRQDLNSGDLAQGSIPVIPVCADSYLG